RASRGGITHWLRLSGLLSHAKVYLNPDDTISFSGFTDAANAPKKWREVQPFTWREVNGQALVKFTFDQAGHPALLATSDMAPVMVFMRAEFANSTNAMLLVGFGMIVSLIAFLSWPVNALVRRHYGRALPFEGRDRVFYRVSRAAAGLSALLLIYWLY